MTSIIDDIFDEKKAEPESSPGVQTNNLQSTLEDDGTSWVEGSELEAAGIIKDAYGNSWQVPGDNVNDLEDLYAGDIYKIPESLSSKFHVQMIRIDQLKEYMLRKFVPVLQEELEIPKAMIKDMGQPLDRYHCVGDSIMVKIPHEIRTIIEAKKIRETKERLLALEPTPEMIKRAGLDGLNQPALLVEHRMGFERANPATRQGIFADEAGNRK